MSRTDALTSIETAALNLGSESSTPDWLRSARQDGLESFMKVGFPGARDEHWKYTQLSALARKSFAPAKRQTTQTELPQRAFSGLTGARLVLIDGEFDAALSSITTDQGLAISNLAQAISNNDPLVQDLLGNVVDTDKHRFASLNNALLSDGAVIDVTAGAIIEEPIYIVFISTATDTATLCNPRVLLRLGDNAQATVIEHHIGLGNNQNLVNVVSEIVLQPGARLQHYQVQESSPDSYLLGGLHISQQQDTHLATHSINLGGRLVRNDLHSRLQGNGSGIEMFGLYLAGDRQHVDNHTLVEHVAEHTHSDQDYKGVLYGRGRAVFNGKAHIHTGARGTEAHQSNSNLLLSEQAEIDTKPELEIYNDDVKCSHGATVGQLDKQALFYLRSRGIDEKAARVLLTFAFAETILQKVSVAEIRERIEQTVLNLLPESDVIREFV